VPGGEGGCAVKGTNKISCAQDLHDSVDHAAVMMIRTQLYAFQLIIKMMKLMMKLMPSGL